MTRRFRLAWPDPRPFEAREGRPIRLLAASDEPDRALEFAANRAAIGPLDAIVGAGDLDTPWLQFLADAWAAPLTFVAGNHDTGLAWQAGLRTLPSPSPGGCLATVAGLPVACLPWPGRGQHGAIRSDQDAWRQAIGVVRRRAARRLRGDVRPLIVLSHAPPAGAGDAADDYHRGFGAYRWLMDRLRPPLWLHGHVTTASVPALEVRSGGTTLVNVTGSVLIELVPPG